MGIEKNTATIEYEISFSAVWIYLINRDTITPIPTPINTDVNRKDRKYHNPSMKSNPSTVLICISMIVRKARIERTSEITVSPSITATIRELHMLSFK